MAWGWGKGLERGFSKCSSPVGPLERAGLGLSWKLFLPRCYSMWWLHSCCHSRILWLRHPCRIWGAKLRCNKHCFCGNGCHPLFTDAESWRCWESFREPFMEGLCLIATLIPPVPVPLGKLLSPQPSASSRLPRVLHILLTPLSPTTTFWGRYYYSPLQRWSASWGKKEKWLAQGHLVSLAWAGIWAWAARR